MSILQDLNKPATTEQKDNIKRLLRKLPTTETKTVHYIETIALKCYTLTNGEYYQIIFDLLRYIEILPQSIDHLPKLKIKER